MNTTRIMFLAEKSSIRVQPTHYAWRPWKRMLWLERIVRRITAPLFSKCIPEVIYGYETRDLKNESIVRLVREAYLQMRYKERPKYVVVGPRQMAEVMFDFDKFSVPPFSATLRPSILPETLYGLKLVYLPWYDGILLLPDLESL